ncbi:MAG TPA: malto-oligosyltrehalose trehalohydrolase [Candidatus Angelobacter sp.]|nr:malto-oligosyltrehalose trehalohydrolase [Candidatus Angelobacter sp.]
MKQLGLSKVDQGMLGASLTKRGCEFRVWAPHAHQVKIRLLAGHEYFFREFSMERTANGHFVLETSAHPGDKYFYVVDHHQPVPDPVSRLLPQGVHGPTEIIDPERFLWSDANWRGLPLKDYVIYEMHIGTFTAQGTFDSAIQRLPYLKKLGITVLEIMPVAAFPGVRNWGYDGVSPYAVQASYGGPDSLRRLVDAAHALDLGVILDVVYNHLGNEGNYLRLFGPYFTASHNTPWGDAVNYDHEGCEGVRSYIIENALYWIREYHMDGLRLDAVQTIHDESNPHILVEIAQNVREWAQELGRHICVIAETDENDEKLVRPRSAGGFGLDAVWSDDFHHAIHSFFTGEGKGYYQDFGRPEQIVRALNEGFVFQGEPFRFWQGRLRGTSSHRMPAPTHVICIQNHDQVGNRAQGERLTVLVPRGARMLAAALLLLAPQTPLLFMGQEFDESNPFQFFTDYGDPALQKAVSEGRNNEFKGFDFQDVPDPQDPATFERSKLNWSQVQIENVMLDWYSALLTLRKEYGTGSAHSCKAELHDGILAMAVPAEQPALKVAVRIQGGAPLPHPGGGWEEALANEADGMAVAVYVRSTESVRLS